MKSLRRKTNILGKVNPAWAFALVLGLLFSSCGDGGPAPYVYEPVNSITGPELVTVSDTEAIFTWVTDSFSDTHVFLGEEEPLQDYNLSAEPTQYHYAYVKGLTPGTRYKYRLQSGDKTAKKAPHSPGRFSTIETPPGEFLFSFATVNDTHVGEEIAGLICISDDVCLNKGFSSPWPDDPYWLFTNSSVVDMINGMGPDFVIHKGDVSSHYLQSEFVAAKSIYDRLQMPYRVCRGNHDRVGDSPADYFKEVFYPAEAKTYQSFVFADHLFIMLDSVNLKTGGPQIGDEQFAWLEGVLDAHPGMRTMVFLHHPVTLGAALWAVTPAERRRLTRILSKHGNVLGVFSGHSHRAAVTHEARMRGVPFAETPSTKEYAGGYCLYRVYTGGYIQTFYRANCPRCLEWYEITKGEYFGLAPEILFGKLSDRNFVHVY